MNQCRECENPSVIITNWLCWKHIKESLFGN